MTADAGPRGPTSAGIGEGRIFDRACLDGSSSRGLTSTLKACRQLRQPGRRGIDERRFEPFVETRNDQQAEGDQQGAQRRFAAAAGGKHAIAPTHQRLTRHHPYREQRKRGAETECRHRDGDRRQILGARGQYRGGTERRSDARASWADTSELKQMRIDEAYRGRGYARELLNAFVAEAAGRGVRRIWVASYDFQAPGMYEKAGFKRVTEFAGWPEGHSNVILCKTLIAS